MGLATYETASAEALPRVEIDDGGIDYINRGRACANRDQTQDEKQSEHGETRAR